ncbi:Ger(x)C family spore germination protein [Shimazuella kribbensis]|uniref:Ger(x)C family spore germination protein n=1 Tax=Shimazuella kribbensis TaxID=139808 RepID=UPI0003FA8D77|nr:Ger(x)C family spore germination protein [Shimazuella kribbensis]
MSKRKLLLVVFLSMVLLLSGCWSRRELNEIALVIGLGVDKIDNEYVISTQIVDPSEIASKGGGGGRAPVVTYKTKSNTLMGAIRQLTASTPRKLYLAHLRMLVLGESIVREGVAPALDVISRDHELRSDFFIIMTKGNKAQDVLTMVTPLEKVPSAYMFNMLRHSEKYWAPFSTLKIDQLDNEISGDGKEPVITAVEIRGSLKEGEQKKNVENISIKNYLQYTSVGVLRQDKLVGYLNETEASGYKYLIGKIKSTVIEMPCNKDHKDVTELIHTNSIIKANMRNHKPSIDVQINSEANVAELECQSNLLNLNVIHALEKKTEKEIKNQITMVLQKTQKEYQSDIFGFGDQIHQTYPKDWSKLKKNWNKTFSTLSVKVNVKVKIRNFGKVNKSTPSMK